LADFVEGFRPEMRFNKPSAHVFKHNNKWYKLSLRIDESDADSAKQGEQGNQITGYSTKRS
jgi:hypothetical protein